MPLHHSIEPTHILLSISSDFLCVLHRVTSVDNFVIRFHPKILFAFDHARGRLISHRSLWTGG